jgi:short-subunit dehydrogenase
MRARDARVLLTGASGGIGRAATAALQQAGAQVMGVGRHADGPDGPDGLPWVQADLATPAGVAAVAEAAARWQANVVVLGAGTPAFGALSEVAPQQLRASVEMNLVAPMLLAQALLPHLLGQHRAQLVFVGSAVGRIGLPGFSVYGAGKGGLHLFAEALRRELADTPVRVQTLGPRSTRTGFNGSAVARYNAATRTATDDPATVARALVDLIESSVAELFIGYPEKIAVRLNGAIGPLLDGSFDRHRRCLDTTALPSASRGAP